jgi:membrane-bound metal-dependent hydrolase YbcI (DUF457 family)
MPSPVGHVLGGAIVSFLTAPQRLEAWGLRLGGASATVVLAAMVPDVDFLWGRHNAETHSLGAATIAGLIVLAWTRGRQPMLALAVAFAWSTHVVFDWLGSDDTPPLGVMALWPFSDGYYFANAYVFEAISRRYWLSNFISHNAYAVAKEILILGPIAFVCWRWRSGKSATETRKHGNTGSCF